MEEGAKKTVDSVAKTEAQTEKKQAAQSGAARENAVTKDATAKAMEEKTSGNEKLITARIDLFMVAVPQFPQNLVPALRSALAEPPRLHEHATELLRAFHRDLTENHCIAEQAIILPPSGNTQAAEMFQQRVKSLIEVLQVHAKIEKQFHEERIQVEAREKTVETFVKSHNDFAALAPALRLALNPLPALPRGATTERTEPIRKLYRDLQQIREVAVGATLPLPAGQRPEIEQKEHQETIKELQAILPGYQKNRAEYVSLREEFLQRELRSFLGLERENLNITQERLQRILGDIETSPIPPPPGAVNHPQHARFASLSPDSQNWLRQEYTQIYNSILPNLQRSLRNVRTDLEVGANIENRELVFRSIRDGILTFIHRRQEYESNLGAHRATNHDATQDFLQMTSLLVARMPFDGVLERNGLTFGHSIEAPALHTLDQQAQKNLHEMCERVNKQWRSQGISRTLTPQQAYEIISHSQWRNLLGNLAVDCIRMNIFDVFLFILHVHHSPNKARAVLEFLSGNAITGVANFTERIASRMMLQTALRSPAHGQLMMQIARVVRHPLAQMAIVTIVMFAGEQSGVLPAISKWIDENGTVLLRAPLEFLGHVLSLAGNGFEQFFQENGLLFNAWLVVDAERDSMRWLRQQAPFGGTEMINTWNARVQESERQEPNPILRRLAALEKIDVTTPPWNCNWAHRRAVDMQRRVAPLIQRERDLTVFLRREGILEQTDSLNGVDIATADTGEPNTTVLQNQFHSTLAIANHGRLRLVRDRLYKRFPEPLPVNTRDPNTNAKNAKSNSQNAEAIAHRREWDNYTHDLEDIAADIMVYRNVGVYPPAGTVGLPQGGRALWMGSNWSDIGQNGYQVSTFVNDGMAVEIDYLMSRQDAVAVNPKRRKEDAENLAKATVRGQDILDSRNIISMFDTLAIFQGLIQSTYEIYRSGIGFTGNRPWTSADQREADARGLLEIRSSVRSLSQQIAAQLDDADPATRQRFAKAFEPIQKTVLSYRTRGNPTVNELHSVAKSLAETVVHLSQDSYTRLRIPNREEYGLLSWTQNRVRCFITGDWSAGREFMYRYFAVDPIPASFSSDATVIHCTPPPSSPTGSVYAFDFNGPNRADWRVYVVRRRATLGARSQGYLNVGPENPIVPFEEWVKSNGPIADRMQELFKNMQEWRKTEYEKSMEAKKKQEELRKKEQLSEKEKKAKQEAIAKILLDHLQNNTSVFRLVPAPLRDANLEADVGPERRVRVGNQIISWRHHRATTREDVRGPQSPVFDVRHEVQSYRRDWYEGYWVGRGGIEQPHHLANPNRAVGEESDRFSFDVRNLDGSFVRTLNVDSWQFVDQADFAQDRDLIINLLCTPSEGTDRSDTEYGTAPLIRMIRLFPRDVYIYGRLHESGKFSLYNALSPLYENCPNKQAFLRTLWSELLEMARAGRVINSAEIQRITKHFTEVLPQSRFQQLPAAEWQPDREPFTRRLQALTKQVASLGNSIARTNGSAAGEKERKEILAALPSTQTEMETFRKSVMTNPMPAITALYEQLQKIEASVAQLQKRAGNLQ